MPFAHYSDWPRLDAIPNAHDIYTGASAEGNVVFDSQRIVLSDPGRLEKVPLAGLLAPSLTECCAKLGFGKASYFVGDTSWEGSQHGTHDTAEEPPALFRVPNLLYVRHKWNDDPRKKWIQLGHPNRLKQLCASGGALHPNTFCMPINLNIPRDEIGDLVTHGNIRLNVGKSLATIHSDLIGRFYVDWLDTMTKGDDMLLYQPPAKWNIMLRPKTAVLHNIGRTEEEQLWKS